MSNSVSIFERMIYSSTIIYCLLPGQMGTDVRDRHSIEIDP